MEPFRNFRIGTRIWSIMAYALLGLTVLATLSVYTAHQMLLEERKEGVSQVVESAVGIIARNHERAQNGELTEAQAKERAAAAVRQMRFNEYSDGSRDYVWINDRQPRMVMHPTSPELEGQDVGDIEDPTGERIFEAFVSTATTEGAGFVEYLWPMPGEDTPVDKVSYVKLFAPWGWVVGSGVYLQRVNAAIGGFALDLAWQTGLVMLVLSGVVVIAVLGIVRPLNRAVTGIQAMNGDPVDLTHQLDESGRDELTQLAASVNGLTRTCRQALQQASRVHDELKGSSQSLDEVTQSASSGMAEQEEQTEQLATAMNEMVATVQEVAQNTSTAAEAASDAETQTGNGREVVEATMEAIQALASELEQTRAAVERLANESDEIETVLQSINGIAEQTNLLALNAAIEAARAGEHGQGFAVVAEEVRRLSASTQESTEQISAITERFQSGAREAMDRMSESSQQAQASVGKSAEAGESLNAITRSVGTISDMDTQIASAAEEQASTAEEINRSVVRIRDVAGDTREGVEAIREASGRQRALVEQLHTELARLRF